MKKIIVFVFAVLLSFGAVAQKHTPDHYDHAIRQAFNENRWDAGKYMLDEAEPYYGNLAVFYELKGWYSYHQKDYNKARYWLSKCLADDNSNTHAKTLISYVEEYTKHYSASICYINELLVNNAYDKTLWIRKINMYRKLGNNTEADKLLKRLSEIYPKDKKIQDMFEEQAQINIKTAKNNNDITTQLKIAKDLVNVKPTAENYLTYVNLLINAGYLDEALNVCGLGIKKTNSGQLMKKKCDILYEQGKYDEALNFIAEHRNVATLQKAKGDIENELAYQSVRYDPYIQWKKLFAKTHDRESFNFIVNTALSRGYYYDALDYINEYKEVSRHKFDPDILYKEYTAYYRLGNHEKAAEILEMLNKGVDGNPYADELCESYYSQSKNLIDEHEYKDAIVKLSYIVRNSSDNTLVSSAKKRLYTCYMATNQLDSALTVVDNDEYLKMADIYARQGKYRKALSLVTYTDSVEYEELTVQYVKQLMYERKYESAYIEARKALSHIDNKDLYSYIIASGSRIDKDVSKYIEAAVKAFPYEESFISAYCGMMNNNAMEALKKRDYKEAFEYVDKGLEKDSENEGLLLTKGAIYEKMGRYDLAYEFQKKYNPSVLEEEDFIKRMQGLQSKMLMEQVSVYYEYYRTESEDVHKSQAGVEYTHKSENYAYSGLINYSAREDEFGLNEFNAMNSTSGAALQIGGTYSNMKWLKNHTLTGKFIYGMKYYPRVTAGIGVEKDYKDWTFNTDFTYKLIKTDSSFVNLYDLSLGATRNFEHVNISGKTDLFIIDGKFYFNGNVKCNYFPFEKNATKLFVGFGLGTAPEMSLTNTVIPIANNKLNTYLNGGAIYFMNKNVGLGVTGSWYSLYSIENDIVKYTDLFYLHINAVIKF